MALACKSSKSSTKNRETGCSAPLSPKVSSQVRVPSFTQKWSLNRPPWSERRKFSHRSADKYLSARETTSPVSRGARKDGHMFVALPRWRFYFLLNRGGGAACATSQPRHVGPPLKQRIPGRGDRARSVPRLVRAGRSRNARAFVSATR